MKRKRYIEEMKLWLFDLGHENLDDEEILKGFIKHYVLHNHAMCHVQDDLNFHTGYSNEVIKTALRSLKKVLEEFAL